MSPSAKCALLCSLQSASCCQWSNTNLSDKSKAAEGCWESNCSSCCRLCERGRARTSTPATSKRSYTSRAAGKSACIFLEGFFLPKRCCRELNGKIRPFSTHKSSPSRTVPLGKCCSAVHKSGNCSCSNSSPRDHKYTSSDLLMSCARMPSHFHSACQSSVAPNSSTSCSKG